MRRSTTGEAAIWVAVTSEAIMGQSGQQMILAELTW